MGLAPRSFLTPCCWLTGLTQAHHSFLSSCRWQWPTLPTTESSSFSSITIIHKTQAYYVALLGSYLHNLLEWRFPRGRGGAVCTVRAATYRSRGVPWLLLLWVVTGDHIATAYLRNPELLDSPDAGSRYEQSAPIAYGSVCRKTNGYPNETRQRTSLFWKARTATAAHLPDGVLLGVAARGQRQGTAEQQYAVSPRGGTAPQLWQHGKPSLEWNYNPEVSGSALL